MRFMLLLLSAFSSLFAFASYASEEKVIFAYYNQWATYSPSYHINDIPLAQVTHLVYKSAKIDEDGYVDVGDEFADISQAYPGTDEAAEFAGTFGQMVLAKQDNPDLKTLISIGGWGRSDHFSNIAADDELRANFVESAVDFMMQYQFDGIEIDWIYPIASKRVEQQGLEADKANYLKLMIELNRALHLLGNQENKKFLLIASISGAPEYADKWLVRDVSKYLDYISLTTAYMHGWWEQVTNHIGPLYLSQSTRQKLQGLDTEQNSINQAIQAVIDAGAPSHKLVLNAAAFATGWDQVEQNNNGLFQTAGAVSWGSWDSSGTGRQGLYSRGHLIGFMDDPEYQVFWDDEAKMNWLFNPNKNNGHFITFENEKSLSAKVAYIESNNLAGIALRQIHNDVKGKDSLIRTLHTIMYPWQAIAYKAKLFYQTYQARIWLTVAFLVVMSSILLRLIYLQRKEEELDLKDRNQYLKLKSQLQQLNNPLQGIAALAQRLPQHAESITEPSYSQMLQVGQTGQQLNYLVHHLLQDTTLSHSPRQPEPESVDINDSLYVCGNILSPYFESKKVQLSNQGIAKQTMVVADPSYLQKLLITLLSWAADSSNKHEKITLTTVVDTRYVNLTIAVNGPAPSISIAQLPNMTAIKQCVNLLGAEIHYHTGEKQQSCVLTLLGSEQEPEKLPEIQVAPSSQAPVADTQPAVSNNTSLEPTAERLKTLQHFSSQATKIKDINELVKEAFEVFVNDPKHPKVEVMRGENLVHSNTEDGDKVDDGVSISHPDLGDYKFQLYSSEPLGEEDIYYYHSLVAQIQMVRRQLHEITKEPQLLSELYEIASRKDKLSYIKAENGYSGIYMPNQADPTYLSLRLKTIKMYFDDDALLQVHRSWLVNPKKVIRIQQISKLKYEVEVDNQKIPIARPYIPVLKQHFPHWFY